MSTITTRSANGAPTEIPSVESGSIPGLRSLPRRHGPTCHSQLSVSLWVGLVGLPQLDQLFFYLPVRLTHGEFRVVAYLARRAHNDHGGDIYPSIIKSLVKRTGLSATYVDLVVKRLRAKRWLESYVDNSGVERWRLTLPACGNVVEKPVEQFWTRDRAIPKSGIARSQNPGSHDPGTTGTTARSDNDLPGDRQGTSFSQSLFQSLYNEVPREAASLSDSTTDPEADSLARDDAKARLRMLKSQIAATSLRTTRRRG